MKLNSNFFSHLNILIKVSLIVFFPSFMWTLCFVWRCWLALKIKPVPIRYVKMEFGNNSSVDHNSFWLRITNNRDIKMPSSVSFNQRSFIKIYYGCVWNLNNGSNLNNFQSHSEQAWRFQRKILCVQNTSNIFHMSIRHMKPNIPLLLFI